MFAFYVIFAIVCVLLVCTILFQDGKTGGLTGVADSASQQVFGAKGASNFLGNLTTGLALIFMCLSLVLALKTAPDNKSIASGYTPPQQTNKDKIQPQPEESGQTPAAAAGEDENTGLPSGETGEVTIKDEDGNVKKSTLAENVESFEVIRDQDQVPDNVLGPAKKDDEQKKDDN